MHCFYQMHFVCCEQFLIHFSVKDFQNQYPISYKTYIQGYCAINQIRMEGMWLTAKHLVYLMEQFWFREREREAQDSKTRNQTTHYRKTLNKTTYYFTTLHHTAKQWTRLHTTVKHSTRLIITLKHCTIQQNNKPD